MVAPPIYAKRLPNPNKSANRTPLPRTAWSAQHGLSRTEAKRRYITTLISTMHQYASTTPEARELVDELEFVWDQIKSNSISSSSSSRNPHPALPSPLHPSRSIQPGPGARNGGSDGGGGLRALRPVSDGDEDEGDEDGDQDDFAEARDGSLRQELDAAAAQAGGEASTRLYELRNRKWRKRMEQAIMRLTTEVAALREQLEAKRFLQRQRRENVWAWLRWLVWVAVRQMVVDVVVWGVVMVWARRKGVEIGVGGLLEGVVERMRRVRVPRGLRLGARGRGRD